MNFNGNDLFIPHKTTQEGQDFMLSLDRDSIERKNTPQKETARMSVMERNIDGCLIRDVSSSETS